MAEASVELAPGHKIGLPLAGPVMLAAGSVGYGEARHRELETARFGGVVVGPFTRRSRGGSQPPRMAETVGGFVRNVGLQNRGVSAAVRRYGQLWPRLGCPVIAQVADSEHRDAAETVERLSRGGRNRGVRAGCVSRKPARKRSAGCWRLFCWRRICPCWLSCLSHELRFWPRRLWRRARPVLWWEGRRWGRVYGQTARL